MGYRIRAAVLAILVSASCWACVEAMLGVSGSNIYLGSDGKIYKTQEEADQTFQKALAEIPARGKPLPCRALVVLPSATAIGLHQLKWQEKMMAQMNAMSTSLWSDGGKDVGRYMERSAEMMKNYREKNYALFVEALKKRQAFQQLVVEKSDRPGLVQRPEYDVNILFLLSDSGQEECLVKTSPLNFCLVIMPGSMTGGKVSLLQWLEELEKETPRLIARQKRISGTR